MKVSVHSAEENYLVKNLLVQESGLDVKGGLKMWEKDKYRFKELSEECGHSVNFKKYCKEGTCFCCDLEEVFNAFI